MSHIFRTLLHDENGFIVSAELVLVATITVVGVIVGLSEVASNINGELNDVGAAFGSINQSFQFQGWRVCGCKGTSQMTGSRFTDHTDLCDGECDVMGSAPQSEQSGGHNGGHSGGHSGGNY